MGATPEIRTAYRYAADLLRVVDGDTIDVQVDFGFRVYYHARIRLLGVNAPELRTAEGKLAKQWVDDWFNEHANISPVLLLTRKPADSDKYGRFLAHVVAPDGHVLNSDLVNARIADPA